MREGHSNREIAQLIGRTESTTNVMFYRLGLHRGASNCLSCGAVLAQPAVGRKRRYCNEDCRTSQDRARLRDDRESLLDPARGCAYCGRTIPLDRQRRGSSTVLYCSRPCSQDAWYQRKCAAEGRTPAKRQTSSTLTSDPHLT